MVIDPDALADRLREMDFDDALDVIAALSGNRNPAFRDVLAVFAGVGIEKGETSGRCAAFEEWKHAPVTPH